MQTYLMTIDEYGNVVVSRYSPDENSQEGQTSMPNDTGVILSNSPDDIDHDIIISSGFRRSFDDLENIEFPVGIVKRLDAPWAAGTGNGGMEAGTTMSSDKTYHAHAITNGSVSDVIFSASPSSPILPSGYTGRKRLGAVLTDSSGKIRQFLQTGNHFQFLDSIYDVAATTGNVSSAAKTFTLTVPQGIKVQADLAFQANTISGFSYLSACDQDLGDAKDNDCIFTFGTSSIILRVPVWTDTSRRINIKAGTTATMGIYNRGWLDLREG